MAWPEWLSPEWNAMHTAVENEIKRALQHCYDSADASGMDWTTEGWISVSASNVLSWLKRSGFPPPIVPPVEAMPMPQDENCWDVDDARSDLTEQFRKALMEAHADDWDMETISEAAHICARVEFPAEDVPA